MGGQATHRQRAGSGRARRSPPGRRRGTGSWFPGKRPAARHPSPAARDDISGKCSRTRHDTTRHDTDETKRNERPGPARPPNQTKPCRACHAMHTRLCHAYSRAMLRRACATLHALTSSGRTGATNHVCRLSFCAYAIMTSCIARSMQPMASCPLACMLLIPRARRTSRQAPAASARRQSDTCAPRRAAHPRPLRMG
jgi:hypothetical protein